jgi:acetyltransferase
MSKQLLHDGTPVIIRPIEPPDEAMMVRFHAGLSDRSVEMRYFHQIKLDERTKHERLARVCHCDENEQAYIAETGEGSERQIVGVARLCRLAARNEAEFAVVVSDAWQHHGIGTALLTHLVQIAKGEGIGRLAGEILGGNLEMQHVAEKLGFAIIGDVMDSTVIAALDLKVSSQSVPTALRTG